MHPYLPKQAVETRYDLKKTHAGNKELENGDADCMMDEWKGDGLE
jgi:hypothetical protein